MKRLIDAIIAKWLCCHEYRWIKDVRVESDWGDTYIVTHYMCNKCGKYKRVKSS